MKKRKTLLITFSLLIIAAMTYVKYNHLTINDIGLKVLSWVKNMKGDGVDLRELNATNTPRMRHDAWTLLLQKHVSEEGQVNYQGFIQDSLLLKKYLTDLTEHPTGKNWSEAERLAYWINAYNAFTVQLIIDHYPVKSIKNIGNGLTMINSPWDIKFFKIGNTPFDLNTIEHEILRKKFNEPRIHFAINCASVSCPKLRNEAYSAEKLDTQLEAQTHYFVNNPNKNIFSENDIQLSKIFDWFKTDFSKKGKVLTFIKPYLEADEKIFNKKTKIKYLEYNWNLNE